MFFRKSFFFLFILLLHSTQFLFAQTKLIDSLEGDLKKEKEDTAKVRTLADLSWEYKNNGEYDKAMMDIIEARDLSKKLNDSSGLCASYNTLGVIFYRQGKYPEALQNHHLSLELAQKLGNRGSIADSYNSIGLVYFDLGDYAEAIRNYFLSLGFDEQVHNQHGIANAYGNIGIAYHYMGNDSACVRYFGNALKIQTEQKDKVGMAFSYNNMGAIQIVMKKYDEALANFNKSLEIKLALGQKRGVAAVYMNMGDLYTAENDYDKALENYTKASTIFNKTGDENGIIESLINFGVIYTKQKKFPEAEKSLDDALDRAKQTHSKNEMKVCYQSLSDLGVAKKDYSMAYENYKLYTGEKDSIQNDENTKKTTRAEMNYEFDKKSAAEKAKQEKLDLQHDAESKNQRTIIYFGSGILLLVIIFAFYAYRSYLQKQKANIELDDKNHKIENAYKIIEHKNTEITDSINYAKKIQQSILPEREDFLSAFPESFVFYRPKDIVGGDFYYLNKVAGKNYLAVADCTGHGVPGAFMSLVGSRELLLANEKSDSVSEILAHLNRGMKATLKQNQLDKTKDGMDIALLKFDGNKLFFSSANRPLWILRSVKNAIEEIKPTKVAIGGFTPDDQVFENNVIDVRQGDVVYIFSDGYSDQFGGEKGKKMTTKKFREFLVQNNSSAMQQQEILVEKHFDEWRGIAEQIDDVLVIGIKI